MSTFELSNLHTDLKCFGLNPLEWSIQRLQGSKFLLQHRHDQEFTLQGQIEFRNHRPRWKYITLFSL